ncbi:FGGY-family carbohydrate kinase [Hoeflea sp. YIM 152468]|uniref:FGGY-family carbohydrate kinase n=1 Tax=Hoeflea sp. YIM 152468 TaxID=3031759 RepID=UPI0023DAD7F5|nr:FGGY-family carbohydrate kinase [Hoeflea sp. YIM 152468]MDF1608905.1 FGGY-family carbohydrate kinase [Hoeflea sp. YIM 152468]
MLVLAIDQGTTNTKALIVDEAGHIHTRASSPSSTHYPQPGWAEQSATAIWDDTRSVIDAVVAQMNGRSIDAIAISNQRETLVAWDAETGKPVGPAILWQCRRTAPECAALISAGHNETVEAATGLGINPLFPASKLAWILKSRPEALGLLDQGRLRAGTVDSWLLWNLTGGTVFATDHSNASRTQLFDTELLQWSAELAEIFETPTSCLPEPRPSDSRFGETAAGVTSLPPGIPIMAMLGDSHAALYGHGVRRLGTVKATYGTGSSLMTLTPQRVASSHGLSGTIAWTDRSGTTYALEGNILVSAQAAAFIAGLLGIGDAGALSDLAQTVDTADGVSFVPALSGLGAPHWNDHATGTVAGMTHGTTPAHVARATFEAIALQIADVFEAMQSDINMQLVGLRTDGGASSNAFLMQLQSDLLQCPVESAVVEEISALGAAAMAFRSLGQEWLPDTRSNRFEPRMTPATAETIRAKWKEAIRRACI